ncbi:MAG: glycosyltransferase family 2 protein [Candidatus Omnitrophica bacterium]|nr:glycosyltransferase family 2 protein [Candidatus Omnitrophota bacterium]
MVRLSIIIPVFNEEDALDSVIEGVLQQKNNIIDSTDVSQIELIVVNDASTDNSFTIVSKYTEVKLINLPNRLGYGQSLQIGFENAQTDLIAFLDGDNTYPPRYLTELCREILDSDASMVIASRFLKKGAEISKFRYIGNRFFSWLLSLLTNKQITDATSGMRIFKEDILSELYPLPGGLNFSLAMTIKAICQNLEVNEYPICYHQRIGHSKLNIPKDGYRFLKTIFSIGSLYSPIKVFAAIGGVFIATAILLSIAPLWLYLTQKTIPGYSIYRLIFALVFLAEGINLILFGLLNSFISILKRKSSLYKLNIVATLLIIGGIALNGDGLYQYIATGRVTVPWIRPLVGAILILLGIHLITFNNLVGILPTFGKAKSA